MIKIISVSTETAVSSFVFAECIYPCCLDSLECHHGSRILECDESQLMLEFLAHESRDEGVGEKCRAKIPLEFQSELFSVLDSSII